VRGAVLALVVAAVLAVAWRWGSYVAGGSDSYCYVHQAQRWASGRLQEVEPLALKAPWPNGPLAFAPAGHVPSATMPGAIVPICSSGLSMAMAPFVLVGGPRAAFLVMPLFGALLVAAVSSLGSRFGARIGVASVVLTAASPIVLFQVIQPMTDVPAAALWCLAAALATGASKRGPLLAGAATSAAILVRPNLVPLGFLIGLYLLLRPERTVAQRLRAGVAYALAAAPGCMGVLLIQRAFYGSSLASGYGNLDRLFDWSHVAPNAERYFTWLVQGHTPAILLALLAPWILPGALSWLLVSLVAANVLLYLPYVVFEEWAFLRFLLPAIPLLIVLMTAVVDAVWRRARWPVPRVALAAFTAVLAIVFIRQARDHDTFRLRQIEARFERGGAYVADALPLRAFVITRWQSGSVRFYSGRKSISWEGLPPDWLERAAAFIESEGYEPYLLLERWEEPLFRRHFDGNGPGALDWPPIAEVGSEVRIYRLSDRARYLAGAAVPTRFVR
jgi:hypothetical protein